MRPEYTDCASSSTAPLNSRSLRVLRRRVVLQRAEVEHLVAVAEVDGGEVALAALAVEPRLAAQARVVAAERDGRRAQRRVAPDVRALQRDLPRVRAVLLHRDVAHVRAVAERPARRPRRRDGPARPRRLGVGGAEAVEHRDLGALAGDDERVREAGEPVALRPVQHHDRLVDDDTGGHLHDRAAGEEGVVQHGERVRRRVGAHAEQRRRRRRARTWRGRTPARPWPRAPRRASGARRDRCARRRDPSARPPPRPPGRHRARPRRRAHRAAPGGTGRKRSRSSSSIRL